jgi:transcriptional regulator with XRE-family HTH domain
MPESSSASTASDVERNISTRLVALRTERGMTQEQVAEACGVTKGYVSKIENARIVPPIGTLVRIAQALNAEVADFFKPIDDVWQDVVSVVRANERQPTVRGASAFGYDYVSLAHRKRNKRMQPFVFSFPEMEKDSWFEHDGEEFLFVVEGRVQWEMQVDGELRSWVLEPGDSLYFESRAPHRGHGLSPGSKALIIMYTPAGADAAQRQARDEAATGRQARPSSTSTAVRANGEGRAELGSADAL